METRPAVGQGRMCGPGHGKRSDWRLVAPLPPGSKYWGEHFQRSDPRTGKETWLQEQGLFYQWNLKTQLLKSDWSINITAMRKLKSSLHDLNQMFCRKTLSPGVFHIKIWNVLHRLLAKHVPHSGMNKSFWQIANK